MSNTMTLIGARQGVQKLVLVLQNDAKSEFDEKAKKVQEEVENMNADEMEEFVHKRFEALNTLFLEKSKKIEEYVISKKPTKPVKTPNETEEEYERKREAYGENIKMYKDFISWSTALIGRLMNWLSELFDDIINFFKSLWTWIQNKIHDISANIQSFIKKIAEKFSKLHEFLFGQA